jgi:endonuclease YncB( thermonuclease family)
MHKKIMVATMVCAAAILCFAVPQKNIVKKTYGSVIADKVLSVDDNLVIRCDIKQWPAIIGKGIPIRINGISPLPTGDEAKNEKTRTEAKKFTADTLAAAKVIILTNIKRGRDFSIVADVVADGVNLAGMLTEKNFALKIIDNANDRQKTAGTAGNEQPDTAGEIVIEEIVIDEIVIEEIVIDEIPDYLASKNSKVFHHSTCRLAGTISEKNIVRFENKNAVIQTGRRPCKICKP